MMQLSQQWVEHTEFHPCARAGKLVRPELPCSCGLNESHTHCPGCGKRIGDWECSGISIGKGRRE